MRIIHLIGYFQPKLGYEEFYLAKNQIEMGHQVLVTTSDRFFPFPNYSVIFQNILGSRDSPKIGFTKELGIPTLRLSSIFEFETFILLKGLKEVIDFFQPEIIHIHEFFSPLMLHCLFLVKLKFPNIKIVVDLHTIPDFRPNFSYPVKLLYLKFIHKISFQLLKKKISQLYATKQVGFDYLYKYYSQKPPIIPLGVDINLFKDQNCSNNKIRDELDLKEGFTLFYSGKIVPRKGLIEIINIFNILGKKYDVNLLMVGSGDQKYLEFLKKGIKNGLKDRVRIVPFIPHKRLPMYMSIGHLGCWLGSIPSASINEFLSVGRPILVKIFEGRNLERLGYSFAKKHMNLKNSLRWIQSLIEDTALYKEQCNQARNYALNHLDWKITTKQIIHLYNS